MGRQLSETAPHSAQRIPFLLSEIPPPVRIDVGTNDDQRVPRGSLVGPTAERARRDPVVRVQIQRKSRKSKNITFSLTATRDPRRSDSNRSPILRFMCADEIGERKEGGP